MHTLISGLNYGAERAQPDDVFNLSLAARGHSQIIEPAIELGAPGQNIVTIAPEGGSVIFDGTSFAAPPVAGLLLADALSTDGRVCGDRDDSPEPLADR